MILIASIVFIFAAIGICLYIMYQNYLLPYIPDKEEDAAQITYITEWLKEHKKKPA